MQICYKTLNFVIAKMILPFDAAASMNEEESNIIVVVFRRHH